MNRLANLVLSVGETLVHEAGRLLFGVVLGRAKELLGTTRPSWSRVTPIIMGILLLHGARAASGVGGGRARAGARTDSGVLSGEWFFEC
jgi:hypothetical protein